MTNFLIFDSFNYFFQKIDKKLLNTKWAIFSFLIVSFFSFNKFEYDGHYSLPYVLRLKKCDSRNPLTFLDSHFILFYSISDPLFKTYAYVTL